MDTPTMMVDLTKKVAVVLEKRKLPPSVMAQVGFAIDISGSTKHLYDNGTMQTIVNRIQALANRFDDNQTLDMWAFHTRSFELKPAVPDMFGSYVQNHIMTLGHELWGGTKFSPVLEDISEHYLTPAPTSTSFLKKILGKDEEVAKPSLPAYLIFLTDGDNDDRTKSTSLVKALEKENIYIQFVAVGTGSVDNFAYIRGLAKEFGNVGFVDFSDPTKVSDEAMFESLLNEEFINWIKAR